MGKKRGREDGSDDEGSDDDLPHFSTGGSSSTTPSVPWQQVLEGLLDKTVMRAGYFSSGRNSCPFTREGLAEFCRVDRAAYDLLRESSGFDLCVDPTSPHTQLGGRAFCSGHGFNQMCHLVQHCGAQPGGKTAAISHSPPPQNDPQAWTRFTHVEQLHYVLLCKLQNQSELPPVQQRDRVQAQQPQAQIAWPPLIMLKNLTATEGDSAAKLKEKFKNWTPSLCVSVYGHHSAFRGDAVLLFATPADDHYRAFEQACSLENEDRHARLVDWGTFETWQSRVPGWAKNLLKQAQFEPRLLAGEKAKQNERVKKLAQVAAEEKLKNAFLAAEKDKEVQRRQEIERSHGEQVEAHEAQLRKISEHHETKSREAQRQIELLESSLKDSQLRYQEEQERQKQAQKGLMQQFGSAFYENEVRHVQAVEAQRAAEMKMRNMHMELAQFKSMMMQKDREAQAHLQAQAAEFEREKAQAAAQAQTAAQAEERRVHEARRAELLQDMKAQMDEDRLTSEKKHQEKEEELRQALDEAGTKAGYDESTYMHQVSQVQAFKTAFKPIDELFKKHEWIEKIEASGRFGWRPMGDLSHKKLRDKGMTTLPTKQQLTQGNPSLAQQTLLNEVKNWQAVIEGAEELPFLPEMENPEDRPTPGAPPFSYKDAFHFHGGSYTAICEHDIPEQEQKPTVLRDGNGAVTMVIPRAPIPGQDASFVRSIRDRYKKKADGILHYLREQVNEYQSCGVSTGYSAVKVAWDKAKDEPMSYAQKVAFLLEHAAQLDCVFDGAMRAEVPGFTPADLHSRGVR